MTLPEQLIPRTKLTLILDPNLNFLKSSLRQAGFKPLSIKSDMSAEEIGELAEGEAILTTECERHLNYAKQFDYDIIALDLNMLSLPDQNRDAQIVKHIVNAVRESQYFNFRGNFLIKIRADGEFVCEAIQI